MDENPLKKWFLDFNRKREEIVKQKGLKTPMEIVDYFTYSKLKDKEPDFCPLFRENQKCHNLPIDELVCYFCACPFYDFEYYDKEKKEYGRCKINSKYGRRNEYGYWDCSDCTLPHRRKFVVRYLNKQQY